MKKLYLSLFFCGAISANEAPLPNPLPLSYLFEQNAQAPEVMISQAQLQGALAKKQQAESLNPLTLNFEGRLGWREFTEETQENHRAVLHLNKSLYDFNRTASAIEAAEFRSESAKINLEQAQQSYRLQLVNHFFNILLADYRYRVENENMAVEYVGFDKIKDQHELKRISDVQLLEAEVHYQAALTARSQAEDAQRSTRLALATLLGDSQKMPDNLRLPKLIAPKLDDLNAYLQKVLANNPQLKALELKHQAALAERDQADAGDNPNISVDTYVGQLDSYPEKREGSWRIDLNLTVPLYDGQRTSANRAIAQAKIQKLHGEIQQLKQQLTDEVSQLYFTIRSAQIEAKQNKVFGDYADLYLDYSRALYENEQKTDLGDAMVRLSKANLQTLSSQFKQSLAWAKLNFLMGNPIELALFTTDKTSVASN